MKIFLKLLFFILLLFFSIVLVFRYHLAFKVSMVQMVGNRFVETSKLESYIYSLGPLSWVEVKFGNVREQLLSEFLALDSIKVDGVFPKQVRLKFSEKKPWLAFYVEQDIYVVSQDGTVLSQGDEMPLHSGETVVHGVPVSFFSEQRLNSEFLSTLQMIIEALETDFVFSNLQIHLEGLYLGKSGYQMNSWSLVKDDEIEIWMDNLNDLPDRFKALTLFFSSLTVAEETSIDYIDMRVPTKMIVGYDSTQ